MKIFYFQKWGISVYVLLTLSIILIIVASGLSYNKISSSLHSLNNRITQDFELTAIKDIRLNYATLDNMVEMYLITHKRSYIKKVDSTSETIKGLITSLKTSEKITERESRLLDSLKLILFNKVKNIKYISRFQQDASIERLIKDYNNMQSIRSAMERAEMSRRRPRTSKAEAGTTAVKPAQKNGTEDINMEYQDVFNISDTTSINPYLKKDYAFNLDFNSMCALIEDLETNRIEQERRQSEKSIKQANNYLVFVSLCVIVFLSLACFVYFRYIKKSAELRKSLSDSKEIAEEMTIIKERFMANMSHEIRTPLNAISGFVDQLHQSNINSKQKKQTEIIQKSIQHILNIVNDILDFSKLNAGKLTLSKKGFEIHNLVQQTIESLEPLIAEKQIEVSCRIDEDIPRVLIGDAYRLKQILLNILGNAIKYTNNGSIAVHLSCRKTSENWYVVMISVRDTGIGIEKAELDNIFKEFHMAENARWTKSGSTGLGLSITKMLVELFQGTIEIDSKINEGTQVMIRIPFEGGTTIDLSVENPHLNARNFLKGKHILIADDEPFNRVLLNNILNKYGAITTEAENGNDVLSLISHKHFDCILMDIKMPEMDGLETSRRIRSSSDPGTASIPIIAVSAAITNENFTFFHSIGVDTFLEKPFKENNLMTLLYKIFSEGKGQVLNIDPEEETGTLKNKVFDLSELQRQAGNDSSFIRDMIITLIDSTHKGIDEIETYLREDDWERIHLTAHRIASPLKFIFASSTYETIKQVENESQRNGSTDKDTVVYLFDQFKEQFGKLEQLLQEYVENQTA